VHFFNLPKIINVYFDRISRFASGPRAKTCAIIFFFFFFPDLCDNPEALSTASATLLMCCFARVLKIKLGLLRRVVTHAAGAMLQTLGVSDTWDVCIFRFMHWRDRVACNVA